MPELVEQMYCSQQIVIPPRFPYILKKYCKAAIKTQPYDLLRWSFEYFKALAENRMPPVKLRLEYPIYSTEGGLTRGCLKVLANQLTSYKDIPIPIVKNAWRGFCLDPVELKRVLCLCEVYKRADTIPFLHFVAVAGGILTKCLTHTMILLCESLTKEPDGGSAAIPLSDFLTMYRFLAQIDASKDIKYYNGYREDQIPQPQEETVEEEHTVSTEVEAKKELSEDSFWQDNSELRRVSLIDDNVALGVHLSRKLNMPVIGTIERSPSVERASQIERENYLRERKGKPMPNEEVDKKLKQLSALQMKTSDEEDKKDESKVKEEEKDPNKLTIHVYDDDENSVQYEIYGQPIELDEIEDEGNETEALLVREEETEKKSQVEEEEENKTEAEKVAFFAAQMMEHREERIAYLEQLFEEIAAIVDRFNAASYDLGMVAGRQMSTTSGEFIAQHIERDIMAYIDEQIAILPDPDLKKKKAKPEEVAMIRDLLEAFLDDNMDIIAPEVEEVEEEEQPLPDITMVYAVPGIGPPVDEDIMNDFEEYALEVSKIQAEVIMPRNLRHFLCPPLEKFVEHNYENTSSGNNHVTIEQDLPKKEQAVVGGVLAE